MSAGIKADKRFTAEVYSVSHAIANALVVGSTGLIRLLKFGKSYSFEYVVCSIHLVFE